jgi:23S rRNA pseudouridine2457 synthase
VAIRPFQQGSFLMAHYIKFYKPYDVLCQFTDTAGGKTLRDYVNIPGVYPVGRLDRDSEGLLLLSDDGALAHRLTDPRYEHPKVYLVQVERVPGPDALHALERGVVLKDGPTLPAVARLLDMEPELPPRSVPIRFRKNVPTAWLSLSLREGRNRQVRRMTAAVGFPTLRLVRVSIGPITLGSLSPGQWSELSAEEATLLRSLLGKPRKRSSPSHLLSRRQRSRTRRTE